MPNPLRIDLPTTPSPGGIILNPTEIVDTGRGFVDLPTSVGIGNFDIYMPRDRLNNDSPIPPSQIPDNLSGAGSIIPYILGEVRTVALPYYQVQVGNYILYMYIVGEGDLNSYRTITIDGTESDISAETPGTAFTVTALDTNARCIVYTGDGVQNVSTAVSPFIAGYPDALADFAVLMLRLPYAVVGSRTPRIELVVRGKEIKDYTNSGTVGFTNNPGNMLAHWVETVEGRTIDVTSATAVANACAEDVGGSPRREAGFAFNRSQEARVTRDIIAAHAGAWVIDTGASVKFVADRPATSIMDIGQNMILGDTTITTASLKKKPDEVIISWQDNDTGLTQQARAVGVVGNKPSRVSMVGIHNAAQAKRAAVERYNHLHLEGDTISFTTTAKGMSLEPGDVFRFTDRRVGVKDKPYRLLTLKIDRDRAKVTAKEYQDAVYSNSTQVDALIPDTDLPLDFSVPQVAPSFVGDTTETQDNGDKFFEITVSWPSVDNNTLRGIRVVAEDNDNGGIETFTLPPSATSYVYRTTEPNTSFTFDITCIGIYADGETSTVSRSTNSDDTFTPNAKYVEAGNDILVTWGDKVPNYVKQFFVLITNNTVGGSDTLNVGLSTKEVFPDGSNYSVTFTSGHSYTVTIQSENRTSGTGTDSVTFTLP